MSYNLDNIPAGTTHVWTYALNQPFGWLERLAFYKIAEDTQVYSRHTGWRKAANPPEWFAEEREAGFFYTIEEALKEKA